MAVQRSCSVSARSVSTPPSRCAACLAACPNRPSRDRPASIVGAGHGDPVTSAGPVERVGNAAGLALSGAALALSLLVPGAQAKLEGVDRPDLLPKGQTPVIDVAGFLTPREEDALVNQIRNLEEDTGFKLRLLAQSYPETPGLAVKDYWAVDDDTIVFVADPTFGGILNFNVGANVDLNVPRSFWSRLSGKFGNKFFWQDKGENVAIVDAVSAIDFCLREPASKLQCSTIQTASGD